MPAPIVHIWSWGDSVAAGPTTRWLTVLVSDSLKTFPLWLAAIYNHYK